MDCTTLLQKTSPAWGGKHKAMVTNAYWNCFTMAPVFGYGTSPVAKKLSKNASFSLHLAACFNYLSLLAAKIG